jgi:Protein of unknown function (DUF3352)
MRRLRDRLPSPGELWARVRDGLQDAGHWLRDLDVGSRLRGARYFLQDVAFVIGRLPRALANGAREFWSGLGIYTRRRLLLTLGFVAAIAVIWLVAIPALPCSFPGGNECSPEDDAIALVPSDALAYVHVNADPDTDQYEEATEVTARLPAISSQLTATLLDELSAPAGTSADFTSIEPWFGGEAALALLPTGERQAEQVQLLEVSDQEGADRFVDDLSSRDPRTQRYRELEISEHGGGLASARVGGFLAVGSPDAVRAVIDVDTGAEGTRALSDDEVAEAALDALPELRFADAYLSEEGVEALVDDEDAPLAQLEPLLSPGSTRGAAAALVAGDEGIELAVRSLLDPERAEARPGFFAAFPAFDPSLVAELPEDTLAYLGIADPGSTVQDLLEQAGAEAPGIAEGFADLVRRVRESGGVDLERQLLGSLGGEAALVLQPRREGGEEEGDQILGGTPSADELPGLIAPEQEAPGVVSAALPTPVLAFLASDVDEERARNALARLQKPIVDAIDPEAGLQAPVFDEIEVEGVDARSVRLTPVVNLTYAVFDGMAVITGQGGLEEGELFERATEGLPGELSLIAYLNLGELIELGEVAGLAEDPTYVSFAREIARLEALALTVRREEDVLATDVRMLIGGR